jgi:hypothetical protein
MAILGNITELVNELGKTVNALGEFRKSFEDINRVAAQTGRDDLISRGAFIDQFKDTGASFKEATGIFKQSLNVGVAGNAANLELITDISRLGLNVGAFSEILATTQQVFGLNAEASIAFTEAVVGAGRQFNIAGDKFAELVKGLQQTLANVSVQFRGDAFKSFSDAATTLAGSIGPTAIGGIQTILSKVTGTTQDSFARLALLGVDPGAVGRVAAGGDTQATLAAITDVAQAAVTLAEQFGVGGPNADPRLLGEFTKLTGFTAQDLLISEKILESSNMGFEALNEQAAEEGRRSQRSRDLTEAFNRLVFNLQDRLFTFFEGLTGGSEAFAEKLSGFGDQFLNAIGATEENFRALGQNIRTFIEGDGFGKLTANIIDITKTFVKETVATFKGIADITKTFVKETVTSIKDFAVSVDDFVQDMGGYSRSIDTALGIALGPIHKSQAEWEKEEEEQKQINKIYLEGLIQELMTREQELIDKRLRELEAQRSREESEKLLQQLVVLIEKQGMAAASQAVKAGIYTQNQLRAAQIRLDPDYVRIVGVGE